MQKTFKLAPELHMRASWDEEYLYISFQRGTLPEGPKQELSLERIKGHFISVNLTPQREIKCPEPVVKVFEFRDGDLHELIDG